MFFLIRLIFSLVILALALGFARTWQIENSEMGKQFASSSAPTVTLDGFYKGSVNLPVKVTWLGKKFNAADSSGVNVFESGSGESEMYRFKTVHGLHGSNTLLYIVYDIPENPFWIRPILDQLVEIAPGEYLGKLTVQIVPGYPFSLGFFKLSK